jgi:ATP-dependent Lhr-like helicase
MASDVVLAEDESRVLREFHDRVRDEIGEGERVGVGTDVDADD